MYRFTEDCLIGVEQIDEEHRELFRLINEMQELLAKDYIEDKYHHIQELLHRLQDYAETHFEHEEEYMEKLEHPELELQRLQHRDFAAKVNEADAVFSGKDQEEFLDGMLRYLIKWLYRHIIGSDMMIGRLVPVQEWEAKKAYLFRPEYLTGIESVDRQHEELFRIIGEVHSLAKDEFLADKYDEIVHLLEELRDYTRFHFQHEEEYMESIGYAGLPAQKKAHEAFVERLEEMDLEQADDHQQETLGELLEFLTEWLINHILYADKKIGA